MYVAQADTSALLWPIFQRLVARTYCLSNLHGAPDPQLPALYIQPLEQTIMEDNMRKRMYIYVWPGHVAV